MAVVRRCKSIAELRTVFSRDMRDREKRLRHAALVVARRGASYIRTTTIPIAFHELERATAGVKTSKGASIRTEAPHAEAVEKGSRPHWVPLAPLIAWVKLRGMQGLDKRGNVIRSSKGLKGSTTFEHARRVATEIRNYMAVGTAGDAISVDAPKQIARAIQMAIHKRGTKPHWYALKALPVVQAYLQEEMNAAVADR